MRDIRGTTSELRKEAFPGLRRFFVERRSSGGRIGDLPILVDQEALNGYPEDEGQRKKVVD